MLHVGHLRSGIIKLGDGVTASVNTDRRQGIRRAHSATHLMHYALQKHVSKESTPARLESLRRRTPLRLRPPDASAEGKAR